MIFISTRKDYSMITLMNSGQFLLTMDIKELPTLYVLFILFLFHFVDSSRQATWNLIKKCLLVESSWKFSLAVWAVSGLSCLIAKDGTKLYTMTSSACVWLQLAAHVKNNLLRQADTVYFAVVCNRLIAVSNEQTEMRKVSQERSARTRRERMAEFVRHILSAERNSE